MYNPQSTYRIQFHKGFTFRDLRKVIPYLHQLGIKTIYASPVFKSVAGSAHGYDGIDPNEINPEIGTKEELYEIADQLRSLGMGWLQDFVPNHMAYSPENKWLCDFLEKGRMSVYDRYFDKNPDEPLMAPFLGAPLEDVIEKREISINYFNEKLQAVYFDTAYPLNYTAYANILYDELLDGQGFEQVRSLLDELSQSTEQAVFNDLWTRMAETLSEKLSDVISLEAFETALSIMCKDPGWVKQMLDAQFYRLCFWKESNTRINYRRFFTINGLICVNIQHDLVFKEYHYLLAQLINDGVIQGLRIDHIDGLYDPEAYLIQLRHLAGPDVYIVVEKILEYHEQLCTHWPVQGTTGYDFLAQVNNLLTNTGAAESFDNVYRKLTPDAGSITDQVHFYKKMILDHYMQGELHNLFTQFLQHTRDYLQKSMVDEKDILTVIGEMLACCPVYRYYPEGIPFNNRDMNQFLEIVAIVERRNLCKKNALDQFVSCFTDKHLLRHQAYCRSMLHFWRRFMQLSGPLMAKGIEDTLMYNHYRFLGHNEVGDSPSFFGISMQEFHDLMTQRADKFPLSISATATHDTKRGEDSRARFHLLSSAFKEWFEQVKMWIGKDKPTDNDLSTAEKYFVLQVVYASLEPDGKMIESDNFYDRLKAFLIKAARESKTKSSWDNPDEAYEAQLFNYALKLIDFKSRTGKAIHRYLKKQEKGWAIASLSQLVLKCMCPGIPDIYQGTEFWDLSFVDPDNRQPVDYIGRSEALARLSDPGFDFNTLRKAVTDPSVKLFCLHKLLKLRQALPDLFAHGSYQPLYISEQYFSFTRSFGSDWLWVIVPLYDKKVSSEESPPLLPEYAPERWRNIFSDGLLKSSDINVADELNKFPVLVFKSETVVSKRSAGVLLPLFSLPSTYGIGDMGKEAFEFVRFLNRSGQKIWQLLPLNPVLKENFYSPYACSSAFAGDPMYIDLHALKQDGLLEESDLIAIELPASKSVDYPVVINNKQALLTKAWLQFQQAGKVYGNEFEDFCKLERHWLDDYVAYVSLKDDHKGAPWYEWPQPFRNYSSVDVDLYKKKHSTKLDYQRWLQFIFSRQWQKLKVFAAMHNIKLVGDIPFYMSNDSADVWANRSLFNIDQHGNMLFMAGVPPDYFSETGQLWGMPTYNWAAHESEGYVWWLARLKQNVKLYDIVRLDHFRAFYDYWEVPGNATTAVSGAWKKGPQNHLFDKIKQVFPVMPFIAEDLGEIHKGVFNFINEYQLSGMRVLQFGFMPYESTLRDLPHNFRRNAIVYTGTHDNNTLAGWFKELDVAAVKALSDYMGYEVTSENIVSGMIQMAYQTVAQTLIIPMQDILGLDESNRINTPSTTTGNWTWRMLPGENTTEHSTQLIRLVKRYNR